MNCFVPSSASIQNDWLATDGENRCLHSLYVYFALRSCSEKVRKDASGDIHVSLDSSPPCWNDGIEGRRFKLSETPLATFLKEHTQIAKDLTDFILRVLRGVRGWTLSSKIY